MVDVIIGEHSWSGLLRQNVFIITKNVAVNCAINRCNKKICFLVWVAVLSLLFEIFVMGKICTVSKT